MKRILTLCALALCLTAANAQKAETTKRYEYVTTQQSYSETQARMVEATVTSYVKPLVAEVEVLSESMKTLKVKYSNAEVEGMNNNSQNLRSRMLYDATMAKIKQFDGTEVDGWNCDLIVSPSFKITSLSDGKGYEVEMRGFPGRFKAGSWRSVKDTDYEWIRVDKLYSDNSNQGQAISNVKK